MGTRIPRLVVVGGGVSGAAAAAAAAVRARELGTHLEVVLLEKDHEIGGKARTVVTGDWLVETGPGSFLDNEAELQALVAETGFEHERVEADPAAARRFLYRDARLLEVPSHPLKFATSGVLGPTGILRMLAEPFVRRRDDGTSSGRDENGDGGGGSGASEDESIWDFAARRIGRQAADRLIAPMILGIYAGDARRLSLASSLPKLDALEREHGSLIRGMLAKRRASPEGDLSAGPSGKLSSFRGGLQDLVRHLATYEGVEARVGVSVERIEPVGSSRRYRLVIAGDSEPLEADGVVLAVEAFALAPLLANLAPRSARRIVEIPMPPVITVAFGYGPEARERVEPGFGVLVPRGQGISTLGVVWDSWLFEGRAPRDHLLVRAMLGGSVDPEIAGLDDDQVMDVARRETARILGIETPPVFEHMTRWPCAIPQYELGHAARVAEIESELEALPGFALAGNSLHGVSFARSASTGRRQGRRVADELLG